LDEVSGLESGLESLINIDDRLGLFFEALGRAKLELEELTHDLRRFKGEIPTDSDLVSELESRRNQLEQLKQDYDASLEDIVEMRNGFQAEKSELESLDQRIVVAKIEAKEAQASTLLKAQLLSKKRIQLGTQLE
jgi:DNA repair ATPase RecN